MGHAAAKFDCTHCRWGRHCDESNPAPADGWWEIAGVIRSRTCLLPMVTPASRFLLRLYRHYDKRLLPYGGGLLDQPNYYLEAMEIIETTLNDLIRDGTEQNRNHGR